MRSLIKNAKERAKAESANANLDEYLTGRLAKIVVIGCGGAGNNSIHRMSEVGVEGARLIAINTDAQDLAKISSDEKILIGKDLTGGLGAGADPSIGEGAARENESEIKRAVNGSDLVFVTCGLGGGTGTGSAPVVAELAKNAGALTVGIVTLPFEMEGYDRRCNAQVGLEKLKTAVDTLIVVPNDKLLEIAPDVPMNVAFKIADEILVNAVKGITELITKPGLINRDFADVRAIMRDGGLALIGIGESDMDPRAFEAVNKALNNPLLDVDVRGAKKALVNIYGGTTLTLEEATQVVSAITERLDPQAKVIWGAHIDESMGDFVSVLLIVTGIPSVSQEFLSDSSGDGSGCCSGGSSAGGNSHAQDRIQEFPILIKNKFSGGVVSIRGEKKTKRLS